MEEPPAEQPDGKQGGQVGEGKGQGGCLGEMAGQGVGRGRQEDPGWPLLVQEQDILIPLDGGGGAQRGARLVALKI